LKASTCSEEGERERVCSCGLKETETIEKTEHVRRLVANRPAYCNYYGYKIYQCANCHVVLEEKKILPLDHVLDSTVYTEKTSTCTERGIQYRICKNCGEKVTSSLPLASHTVVQVGAKGPTMTEDGYTASSYCSVCSTVLTKSSAIPKGTPSMDLAFEKITDTTCKVTGLGTHTLETVIVPSEYDGMTVVEIGDRAFSGNNSIKYIYLPDTIKKVGNFAFQIYTKAKTVNMPADIEYIGDMAYYGTSVSFTKLPNTVSFVGRYAFSCCDKLINVEWSKNCNFISDFAFAGCSNLKVLSIPSNVTSAGNGILESCYSLTDVKFDSEKSCWEKVSGCIVEKSSGTLVTTFPGAKLTESIRIISTGSLINLDITGKELVIPEGVVRISNDPFSCYLRSMRDIEDDVSPITMPNVASVETLTLPSTLESIGEYAFYGFSSLTKINFSEGLKQILEGAFSGCPLVGDLILPNSLESVGHHAFAGTKLTKVTLGANTNSVGYETFGYIDSLTEFVLSEGITRFADYCTLYASENIKRIYLPKSLVSFGNPVAYNNDFEKFIYAGTKADFAKIVSASEFPLWYGTVTEYHIECSDGLLVVQGVIDPYTH